MVLGAIAGAIGGKVLGGVASKLGGSMLGKMAGGLLGKISGLLGGGAQAAGGATAKDPTMAMLGDIKNLLQQLVNNMESQNQHGGGCCGK